MLLTKSEIQGSFGNNLVAYGYLYDACSAFGNVRNRFPDLYNDRSEEFALSYGKTIDDLCTMGVGY